MQRPERFEKCTRAQTIPGEFYLLFLRSALPRSSAAVIGPVPKSAFARNPCCYKRPSHLHSERACMTVPLKPGIGPKKTPSKIAKDFQDHLADLEARGLVVWVDRPINKDTELH